MFKGKMAGHKGDKLRTMLNLEIIKSDMDNNLIYLRVLYLVPKTQQFTLESHQKHN